MEDDKKNQVRRIFDSIAARYDLLNHLLSFGIDFYWRRKALLLTGLTQSSIVLDIACGTGDFAIAAKKMGVDRIYGADFSLNMLKLFILKSNWIIGNNILMTAEKMPLKNESFSNITVAFGVRNFYNIREGFGSFYRVLKKNGKATILEFCLPSNFFFRIVYKFYFTKILPLIGGIISGEKEAYTYLPHSVEEFDARINLPELLSDAGFKKIEQYNLTLGIVQVTVATK